MQWKMFTNEALLEKECASECRLFKLQIFRKALVPDVSEIKVRIPRGIFVLAIAPYIVIGVILV